MELKTAHIPGDPRIAYDEMGAGPPVVFLHGIGGNRTNWRDQLQACAPQYRAIAWDARGYGQSDDYEGPLDFSQFADDMVRLLDHLEIAKAILVGLSMGGRISQDLYFRYPGRVGAMVLCDTFPGTSPTLPPKEREEFIALRKGPLVAGKTLREMAEPLAKTLVSANAAPDHFQRLVESIEALHQESYIKTLEASMRYDRAVDLGTISVPVQLIYGAEDRLTPPGIGEEMARQIPGALLAVIEGAGHLVNIERGEEFNRVLLDFLAQQ
ncbi:MAG: alpha/beta fold hydrolase [Alphaproteobacteria bacterium]|jgi:3-oxoadipate enol-lactonase|nr:alpha/beta fold hydrolase [Alphaproteobacteria bacterium]